jgi:hypothetical protein
MLWFIDIAYKQTCAIIGNSVSSKHYCTKFFEMLRSNSSNPNKKLLPGKHLTLISHKWSGDITM